MRKIVKRVVCVTVILTELGRKCVGTYGPGKRFCMCKGRIICGVEVGGVKDGKSN